jgi:formylglycine-generating enzyme required for sulfatase activity
MRTGGEGPEMVVLAGGTFQMGSDSAEAYDDEAPVHAVTVAPFDLAKHELTKGEFARFVEATGYETEAEQGDGCYGWTGGGWEQKKEFNWKNLGFEQRDDHPVVCVSWSDANTYLDWLSAEAGATYRLPTEAEWEYAVRGETQTERFWGDDPDDACRFANVADESNWSGDDIHGCNDDFAFTAPVGRFEANPFGRHDGLGNVLDVDLLGLSSPYDGTESKCESNNRGRLRIFRGGSRYYRPALRHSSARGSIPPAGVFAWRIADVVAPLALRPDQIGLVAYVDSDPRIDVPLAREDAGSDSGGALPLLLRPSAAATALYWRSAERVADTCAAMGPWSSVDTPQGLDRGSAGGVELPAGTAGDLCIEAQAVPTRTCHNRTILGKSIGVGEGR